MASFNDVLTELNARGITYNPESEIFDEGDISCEQMLTEYGIEDFGPEMSAYVTDDSIEIVSIRNSATVNFSILSAADAAEEIAEVMDKFYRDLA